jgi:hypothetical protein
MPSQANSNDEWNKIPLPHYRRLGEEYRMPILLPAGVSGRLLSGRLHYRTGQNRPCGNKRDPAKRIRALALKSSSSRATKERERAGERVIRFGGIPRLLRPERAYCPCTSRTSNIQHRTPNIQQRRRHASLEVRCWMLDVGCSPFSAQGRKARQSAPGPAPESGQGLWPWRSCWQAKPHFPHRLRQQARLKR